MTEIDYEKLAKAAYGRDPIPTEWDVDYAWEDTTDLTRQLTIEGVRAIVAALRDQGLVVVRADALRDAREYAKEYKRIRNWRGPSGARASQVIADLGAALAAPEPTDPPRTPDAPTASESR